MRSKNEQHREKREESREKREERREKREERNNHDQDERVEGRKGSVPEGRDGTEKCRPLGGKREESREKREERRETREETSTIKMRGSKDAMVRSQKGGMA